MVPVALAISKILHEARNIDRALNEGAYPNQTVANPGVDTWIPGLDHSASVDVDVAASTTLASDDGQSILVGEDSHLFIHNNRLYVGAVLEDEDDPPLCGTNRGIVGDSGPAIRRGGTARKGDLRKSGTTGNFPMNEEKQP